MKVIIVLCCCSVLFCAGYLYATMERENEIDYFAVNSMELHTVQCMQGNGDLQTYEIPIPEYISFSEEDTKLLREEYIKGFCDSL